jgi:hypothetical protein
MCLRRLGVLFQERDIRLCNANRVVHQVGEFLGHLQHGNFLGGWGFFLVVVRHIVAAPFGDPLLYDFDLWRYS